MATRVKAREAMFAVRQAVEMREGIRRQLPAGRRAKGMAGTGRFRLCR
ncbi:hypothetical protein KFO32_14380 [Pantoea ananatis]|nr:hypothetical protein [Pantoea ananatis]MCK0554231.1 hypothetical protein [Pantoea ananatis]